MSNATLPPKVTAADVHMGEISVVMATRSRPEMVAEVFKSLAETTVRKDKTVIWLYVDDDDQVTIDAINKKAFPDPGFPVHWHIAPRPDALGKTHQALWIASGGTSQVYVTTADDARFVTHGWDEIVRKTFDQYPDGVLLGFPHDPMTADQATYPVFGWGWLNTLGFFFPGYFPYWFDDKWMDQVGRMAGRCTKLPFDLPPIGGKGKTKRMRNNDFWTRYFQMLFEERKESARKLLVAVHGENSAGFKEALVKLEQAATVFAKEQVQFSDIYCIFQEERFTEMTPEQREQFHPKLFAAEARAVSHVITLAQAAMAKKNYAEAMEHLDCTAFSDIRVRQAQALKAECLRALGRSSEAEPLMKETLAVWPRMNFLRRTFRFLGMVSNDGKRMLVGLTSNRKHN